MEVTQFTYFQQCGGIDCKPVCGEITYGLERLEYCPAMVLRLPDIDNNAADGLDFLHNGRQQDGDMAQYKPR